MMFSFYCSDTSGDKRIPSNSFSEDFTENGRSWTPLCGSQNSFFTVCPHNTDIILWSTHSQTFVDWIHSQSSNSTGCVWERKLGLNIESSLDFYRYLSVHIGFSLWLMKHLCLWAVGTNGRERYLRKLFGNCCQSVGFIQYIFNVGVCNKQNLTGNLQPLSPLIYNFAIPGSVKCLQVFAYRKSLSLCLAENPLNSADH